MSLPQQPTGSILSAAQSARRVPVEELAPGIGLLIVNPHPDDETLGCGQALAAAAAAGRDIGLILLTDGEASHPNSQAYPELQLRLLRLAEFEKAVAILAQNAVVKVRTLGLPDGKSHQQPLDNALWDDLKDFAEGLQAGAVWSTWSGDPHCDHEHAAQIAARMARELMVLHWSFPVWGRFGQRSVPDHIVRFEDGEAALLKGRAMCAYASQLTDLIEDDVEGFAMPSALTDHFEHAAEIFVRER